jgi:hypothetical protein
MANQTSLNYGVAGMARLTAVVFFLLSISVTTAQKYSRDFKFKTEKGREFPCWNPDPSATSCEEIVDLSLVGIEVELQYNYYFMKTICANAADYLKSAANKARR